MAGYEPLDRACQGPDSIASIDLCGDPNHQHIDHGNGRLRLKQHRTQTNLHFQAIRQQPMRDQGH